MDNVSDNGQISLSVVLPVYNDADNIRVLVPQLAALLQAQSGNCEIVVVDDGSSDRPDAACAELAAGLPENVSLQLVRFSRNFGKEAALSAGLAQAQGDKIALMDADGQHPVPVLAQMLELYAGGQVDMVAAVQSSRTNEGRLLRSFKRGFYHFIQDKQRYEIRPNAGDFRLMNRKVADALLSLPERQRFMKGLYAWVGFRTVYLPFEAEHRVSGKSKFNYPALFELALIGITSFSQKPLRWIARMGMLVSLVALAYGAYIVADTFLFGKDLAGWPTLAAGIMFSAGVQLICLGVIGEYIGRIYEEVKQRPLYVVDDIWHSRPQR